MLITGVRTLTSALSAPALTSSVSGSTATLNWTAPTPTGQSVIAGYRVYKASTLGGTYTKVGSDLPANQLSLTDTLSATSFYKVEAFDQFVPGIRSGGVQCSPLGSAFARIHPGHRFWLNNQFYPGNQQGQIAAACSTIAANSFNGLGIIMTWANISDAALTGGAQTFNIFRTNMTDVLTRVKNAQAASSNPNKKIYVTFKWWHGGFQPSYNVTTTSQSGNTLNVTGATLPSGLTIFIINGHQFAVSSNTSTSVTLSSSPGTVANGTACVAAKPSTTDGSMWPAWLIAKGNWVKAFVQPNTNARAQLNYDLQAVWDAQVEMFAGIASVLKSIDTDNRVDIVAFGDESVAATVDISGNAICNGANYQTQFTATMNSVKDLIPDRTVWCTMNYSTNSNDALGCQTIFTALQNHASSGFGYGGPDSPTFGTHGNVNGWYTTFLNVITGLSGTLGDVRDTCLRIGNTEGPGLLGAGGGGWTSKPTLTLQQGFDDIMTRKSIPANGSIGAHTGLGCSVMHWDYQSSMYFKTADIVTVVNANNGSFTALPPGNWDTSP